MSKSAITPSFNGRMAWMWAGVRPTIRFASVPTASGLLSFVLTATTDGSLSTMPLPRTYTTVFAVPRSTAMSFPTTEDSQGRGIRVRLLVCFKRKPAYEIRKEECDLPFRGLGPIRTVHEVLARLEREVAADRPRGGVARVRRAHHGSHDPPSVRPTCDDHRDERATRDERDQLVEERLAVVLGVVALREVGVDAAQVHRDDREAASLEAAHELALDRVGLAEEQRTVAHRRLTLVPGR